MRRNVAIPEGPLEDGEGEWLHLREAELRRGKLLVILIVASGQQIKRSFFLVLFFHLAALAFANSC